MRDCFLFAESSEEEGSDDEMIADKDSDVSGVGSDPLLFACNRNCVSAKGSNIPVLLFPQENWDEDEEKEEQSDEQEMTVEKEINGDSDLEPENESEEE